MREIQMVDLHHQYHQIKDEIDEAIQGVIESSQFINGPVVKDFESNLASYLGVENAISCANGTDALQIALMALDLQAGDEVITPSFCFAAAAEMIAHLGFIPVFADVELDTYNIQIDSLKSCITSKTKAIIPVHLFGQCANMHEIMKIADEHGLFVIEDNAQAIGAECIDEFQNYRKAGTIGHIATTSFFPSKNLGAFGDAGALFTNDDKLANKIRMIKQHGSQKKYQHEIIGLNSRLDAIQAAILNVKLNYLNEYNKRRNSVAMAYDRGLGHIDQVVIPKRSQLSSHVFHQYTIRVKEGRDSLKEYLYGKSIPSMIYYPVPLHLQNAYRPFSNASDCENSSLLSKEVLSLPISTEMDEEQINYIINCIKDFFNK